MGENMALNGELKGETLVSTGGDGPTTPADAPCAEVFVSQDKRLLELRENKAANDSNISRFISSTSPLLLCQLLSAPKAPDSVLNKARIGTESFASFSLTDVWSCFEEWSVFGCGVPLSINDGESITQYYVPYLSAVQIFSRHSIRPRRPDEGESETDYKDSSSEFSDNMASSDSSSEPGSDVGSVTEEGEGNLGCRSRNCGNASCASSCCDCLEKNKIFEYFEQDPPHTRVPMFEKIQMLSKHCSHLQQLKSSDIHFASWFSVAWYPLYRIPTGSSLRDVGACFLTYHSLSLVSPNEQCRPCSEKFWIAARIPSVVPTNQSKEEAEAGGITLHLTPFGMSSHKLNSSTWNEKECAKQLLQKLHKGAEQWLKQQSVSHHDFEFFQSHSSWQ